jgi:hypothetical protein
MVIELEWLSLVVWLGKMSIEPKSEKRKRKELLFK